MKKLWSFLSRILALYACVYLLPSVAVDSFIASIVFVITLSLLYFFIKPLLMLFAIPINFMTLGLFTFVINTVIVLLADWLIRGVIIGNFIDALIFSIVYSAIIIIAKLFYKENK